MTLSLDLKCVQQTIIEIAECGRIPNQRRVEFFRGILVESAHAIVEQIVVNMTAVTGYAFSDEISFGPTKNHSKRQLGFNAFARSIFDAVRHFGVMAFDVCSFLLRVAIRVRCPKGSWVCC